MLDNRLQLYFPQILQQLGWILILFGVLTLFRVLDLPNPLVSAVMILVGTVLSLTYRGARLDLKNRLIKQYVGVIGVRFGSWKNIPELQEIVFTSNNYSQQIHSLVSRRQVNTRQYRAFLKGSSSKLLFSSGSDAEKVRRHAGIAADALNLPAIDYTIKPPARI